MLISKLGEFGLIDRFNKAIKTDAGVVVGSGDDCAVLKWDKEKYLLATCDMIVEGVDFSAQDKPHLIGRKALSVSLSDIASCAGLPRYCLVSLGAPKSTSVEFMDRLLSGMLSVCRQYKINIVGGDLSRSDKIVIDVSMLGFVEKDNLVLRRGAKIGDTIFVTGKLGGSNFGKHLKFSPRIKEARFLVNNFKVNSMIDISDGLCQDLGHILRKSRVGAKIFEDLIPLSKKAQGLKDALYTGEDFELLFTLSKREAQRLLKKGLAVFVPIGEIMPAAFGLSLVDKKNKLMKLSQCGFKHF